LKREGREGRKILLTIWGLIFCSQGELKKMYGRINIDTFRTQGVKEHIRSEEQASFQATTW